LYVANLPLWPCMEVRLFISPCQDEFQQMYDVWNVNNLWTLSLTDSYLRADTKASRRRMIAQFYWTAFTQKLWTVQKYFEHKLRRFSLQRIPDSIQSAKREGPQNLKKIFSSEHNDRGTDNANPLYVLHQHSSNGGRGTSWSKLEQTPQFRVPKPNKRARESTESWN